MSFTEREFLRWDALGLVNAGAVAKAAYRGLSSRQHLSREAQVVGAALMFLMLCEVWKVKNPIDILKIASNVYEKNSTLAEVKAAEAYIRNEL